MEETIRHSQKCLKDNGKYRKWKKEELEYLREICYGRGYKEIAEMITEKFGKECSEVRVKNRMNKDHLRTGIETKFTKGIHLITKVYLAQGGETTEHLKKDI